MPTHRSRLRRRAVGAAVGTTAAALLCGVGLLPTVASATSASTPGVTTLPDSFSSILSLPDVVPDGQFSSPSMTVGVWIPGATAALEAYATAVSTPGSASYGQYLTPAQVDAQFGVSRLESDIAQRALEADGLTPVYVAADDQYVELTGSSSQVEATFHVTLDQVLIGGKTFFANTTDATVPAAVGAVIGLSNLSDMSVAATVEGSQDMCDTGTASVGAGVTAGCLGTMTGQNLAGVYDAPASAGGAYDPADTSTDYGQGQRIAIFGEGNVNDVVTALRTAEATTTFPTSTDIAKSVLPQVPVREVLVNDPQNANADTSGEDEFDLDSQSSTEMSPLLSELDFYFGNSLTDQSIAGTYSAWVNDPDGPVIGNSSFGGCEPFEYISGGEQTDDALLAQGVAMGRSMFVSSGDAGAGGCQTLVNAGQPGAPAVEDPGSSQWVTAVGGTVVASASTGARTQAQPPSRFEEYGWNDSTGGYADFSPMPADQKAVVASATAVPPVPCAALSGAPDCREVPDVAANSGGEQGGAFAVIVCTGASACTEADVLGTSLASPTWAGMWARVRAAHDPATAASCTTVAASSQKDLGFAQPDLYQLAATTTLDAKVFFNVGGTTDSVPANNGPYSTMPRSAVDPTGYSLVDGLGSPDLTQMIDALDCSTAPVAAATPGTGAVTVVDAGTIPQYSCPSGEVVGGATPEFAPGTDPGLQLETSQITGSASGATFTLTTKGAPTTAATDDSFITIFGIGGQLYGVDVDPGGEGGYGETGAPTPTPGTAYFHLVSLALTNVNSGAGVTVPVLVPSYLATLTGASSPATGSYTIDLPFATFNTAAAAVSDFTPMSQSSVLDPVEVLDGTQPGFATTGAQQVSDNTLIDGDTLQYPCAQYLETTTTPTPALPEASVPAGMLGLGVAAGGWALLRLRRRRQRG